jgi:hypothetical protein
LDEYQRAAERALMNTVPVRLGTHSDWIAVAGGFNSLISLAADGSMWYWPLESFGGDTGLGIPALLDVSHKPQYLGNIFNLPD